MPNPFEIMGLDPDYEIDTDELESRHRALSGALHPDRYASSSPTERRMSLDRAIAVNQAYRTLKDPVRRAEALLATFGVETDEKNTPAASPALLMEMMEIRESLDEARQQKDLAGVRALGEGMRTRQVKTMSALSAAFRDVKTRASREEDGAVGLDQATQTLGELRYLRRFFEELEAVEETLLEG
ncbi:MAG: Fe-S protein assembly co-chaperone HscB [Myxococcota bacterium]